ncbi:MAG: J domain-containing protein [Dehalococcoidales bacterium]
MKENWEINWVDYYEKLGIPQTSDDESIKKQYVYKNWILHSDLLKQVPESIKEKANKELTDVNNAYEVLKDPVKRREYDQEWLKRNSKNDSSGFQNEDNSNKFRTESPEQRKTEYKQKSNSSVRNKYRIILLSSACLIVIFLLTWHFAFSSTNKTPTSTVNNSPSTTIQLSSNDSWVGDLSKVAGISLANIPPGSYVSDAYLGTRTLVIKGNVLTMDCEATTGNSANFPQLGTHTYQYVLLGDWNTQPTLDECYEIYLKDVVSGNIYMPSFKNVDGHGIIVLGGDSYTLK